MARITNISIVGLLDYFAHSIEFPSDWRYILLYGPNGVGKTRLLEILHALYSRDFDALYEAPFDSLSVTHDDNSKLLITRSEPEEGSGIDGGLSFTLTFTSSDKVYTGHYEAGGDERLRRYLLENTSWEPISGGQWRDSLDGEITDFRDLYFRYGPSSDMPSARMERAARMDERINQLIEETPVHFIETQRLLYDDLPNFRPARHREVARRRTIDAYAEDIKQQMATALAENSRRTQQLDRSFPRRLLEDPLAPVEDANIIRERYEEQSAKRSRLAELGLINSAVDVPLPVRKLNDWELRVLNTYLDDTDDKLETFDHVAARVSLLEEIVHRRFFNKTLRVNIREGIVVTRDSDGRIIPPSKLSSGEQHELVLMYDLLFNVPQGALVLVDEPEISLHVAWQKSFIQDIDRIAQLADLRFMIATHSPQIINKSWDRTAELGPQIAGHYE
ncbi:MULTISPECIES: AAA family ATPase [unclassified Mycobacterium]|uniref:AAA family ATPase n=1 Tax=unclassified Mycobacterium TaxID=2642494 RepID=UPI0007FF1FF0|nr:MULTISPECIES: AAA family ATPase [unclassified Mycobacterium]OBG68946.1 hypothetical protein A5703_09915 [Mycobacterium sp. E188]OBH44581.1 hypothetical protein A5691_01355 [Mycobacterium sp. E183]